MGTTRTTPQFDAGDGCMFLVQDAPGAAPQWVTGTILAHTVAPSYHAPYAGFVVARDGFACNYFIAEEEVRSL